MSNRKSGSYANLKTTEPLIIINLVNGWISWMRSGSKVINSFSYSTQLSMKFFLLINIKMPTIVGILIFISRKNFMLSSAVQEV